MTLSKIMTRAARRFSALTERKAADGDFSLRDIDQAIKELNALQDALEFARAQFESACEDAGGADARIPDNRIQCDNGGSGVGEGYFS